LQNGYIFKETVFIALTTRSPREATKVHLRGEGDNAATARPRGARSRLAQVVRRQPLGESYPSLEISEMELDPTTNEPTRQQLNQLYWSSSQTIDEILADLGIGRNTLYSLLDPLPAGLDCPTCVDYMVFTNRTNRASGTAICVVCGIEGTVAEPVDQPRSRLEEAGDGLEAANGRNPRWRDELGSVAPERAALIGGAAALGVVVGAAAARALRH